MAVHEYLIVEQSLGLQGSIEVDGAKNAVLVIMASLILTSGRSKLMNVPLSADVVHMIKVLEELGARVIFNEKQKELIVDTTDLHDAVISPELMKVMRASVLVTGPLLVRFGKASIAIPGGCRLGARPIDFHVRAFARMGACIIYEQDFITMTASKLHAQHFILEYPSVGATENMMMAAALTPGITRISNAAIEPEVLDLICVLRKMGAKIQVQVPGIIEIEGVATLDAIEHVIIPDRLEAGTLLLAAAVTGGSLEIPNARFEDMEVFLEKLSDMGHAISRCHNGQGIALKATLSPRAVSFRTMPYPGFPTDLQSPMMAAQCVALGTSAICETVFENRIIPTVRELQKFGAQVTTDGPLMATVQGVDSLYGASVVAPDLRAAAALVIAGLAAQGQTTITGVHHVRRGYTNFDEKLRSLGARVHMVSM